MNALLILVLISLIVAILFLVLFAKAIFNGQFDEIESPSIMMLNDDDIIKDEE